MRSTNSAFITKVHTQSDQLKNKIFVAKYKLKFQLTGLELYLKS